MQTLVLPRASNPYLSSLNRKLARLATGVVKNECRVEVGMLLTFGHNYTEDGWKTSVETVTWGKWEWHNGKEKIEMLYRKKKKPYRTYFVCIFMPRRALEGHVHLCFNAHIFWIGKSIGARLGFDPTCFWSKFKVPPTQLTWLLC